MAEIKVIRTIIKGIVIPILVLGSNVKGLIAGKWQRTRREYW
jgi:hypothetical protein